MKNQIYFTVKRGIDIIGSVALSIIFLPICLITAILIKLGSKGPVFANTPPRVSKNGKSFKLYKFRSMIINAHNILKNDPKYKNLYERYKKNSYKLSINEDPRITKVGKFIRKHSIDEMPQLLNILRGEMSLVGPRPYYSDELTEQQKKYPKTKRLVEQALSVKPGVTGLWQVSGRSEVNFDKRIKLDAYYANQKSLILDFIILLKSPWVMITGKGAV